MAGHLEETGAAGEPHEAGLLALDISKAMALLGWAPVWGFPEAVRHTVTWYRQYHGHGVAGMREFCLGQIRDYSGDAARHRAEWSA